MTSIDNSELGQVRDSGRDWHLRTIGSLLVSLIAIGAVVWWALRQKAPTFPSGLGPISLLVASVGCYTVATLLRGVRWHEVLRLAHVEHHPSDAIALIPVGYMGNTILPARAGEILRVLLLKARSSASRREILGSIIAERGLDAAVIAAMFATMTAIGIANAPTGKGAALIAVGVLVAGALGVLLLLALRRRGRFERFAVIARPFLIATKLLLCRRGALLALMTAAIWLIEGFIYWLIAQSLDLPVSYLDGVYLVVLAGLAAIVPAGPGFIGTVDAAIIFGLAAIGIEGGQALSFAILVRFIIFVQITIVGLILMLVRYGGLGKLRMRTTSEVDEPVGE